MPQWCHKFGRKSGAASGRPSPGDGSLKPPVCLPARPTDNSEDSGRLGAEDPSPLQVCYAVHPAITYHICYTLRLRSYVAMAGRRWRAATVACAILLMQPCFLLLSSSSDVPPQPSEARAPGTSRHQAPPSVRPGQESEDEEGSKILDAALSGLDEDDENGRDASSRGSDSFDDEKEGQSEDGTVQSLLDVER